MPITTAVELKMRRSDCFKLLAACFYEPEKELFIQEHLCENLAALLAASNHEQAAAAAEMLRTALEAESDKELKVEYARLFVGPFELVAPPYGSIYLEQSRRLMGDSTMAVSKMYQAAGLALEVQEAPDHIALELEFMHFLCRREAEATAQDNNDEVNRFAVTQALFMRKFLAPWLAGFCQKIRQGTTKRFYSHLADCLEEFAAGMLAHYESAESLREPADTHACRTAV